MSQDNLIDTEKAGGTRYSEGKPSGWWYAPLKGLELVMPVARAGAKKYAPKDWLVGQSYSTLLDCGMRHMIQVLHFGVQAKDSETGYLHLAHAVWNFLALLTFMALGRDDLDDVTMWEGVTAAEREAVEADRKIAGHARTEW